MREAITPLIHTSSWRGD